MPCCATHSKLFCPYVNQTFAKLQQFTSSIRTNKQHPDHEDAAESKKVWKNAKEVAIEKLQRMDEEEENENGKRNRSSVGSGEKEEFAAYSGQVLEGDSDGEGVGDDWYKGKLKFRKHVTDKLRIGGDGRRVDDYEVIDSRAGKKG
jgi:hypothetical protein